MTKHWKYLKYVLRHKWYCMEACFKNPSWLCEVWILGIIHDWSKFRPSEWFPYAEYFYGFYGVNWSQKKHGGCGDEIKLHKKISYCFDKAWLLHQHRNKHHWQYWVLREDDGGTKLLDMPDRYILEIVADWYAAGMAIAKRPEISPWYEQNKSRIMLSDRTRKILETVIKNFDERK